MIDPEKLLPCRLCGSLCSEQYFPSIQGTLWACSNSVRLGGICEAAFATSEEAWNTPQPPTPYGKVHTDGSRSGGMPPGTNAQPPAATPGTDGKNGTAPANPMGQPPAPYGKIHTDGSRSGGMPPGTNARPPAPQDMPTNLAEALEADYAYMVGQPPAPQDDLVEELPQPLKDLLHHIVQCMVAEGCGEISAWESLKTIWPAITDYFAPIAAERDAALSDLEQTFYDRDERIGELKTKLAAAEAHLRQAADNLESGAKLYDCPGLEAAAKLARIAYEVTR